LQIPDEFANNVVTYSAPAIKLFFYFRFLLIEQQVTSQFYDYPCAYQTLREKAGVKSNPLLRSALKELEDTGWIQILKKGHYNRISRKKESNVYRITNYKDLDNALVSSAVSTQSADTVQLSKAIKQLKGSLKNDNE
jgi:hypothetical protein